MSLCCPPTLPLLPHAILPLLPHAILPLLPHAVPLFLLLLLLHLPPPSSAHQCTNVSSTPSSSSSPSLHPLLVPTTKIRRRSKRQFGGFGGCCPLGGIGPVNFPFCCSASIGISPCCAPSLLPMLPPPMPLLPPPLPLPFPLISAGCCPCCMPMCVPICIRSSCGIFGGGMLGGTANGCTFGGWKRKRTARQKRGINTSRTAEGRESDRTKANRRAVISSPQAKER